MSFLLGDKKVRGGCREEVASRPAQAAGWQADDCPSLPGAKGLLEGVLSVQKLRQSWENLRVA